jgi:hypothetical protein
LPLLAAFALAGCGSAAPDDLPAPAASPTQTALLDHVGDRLAVGDRSARTCREPIDVTDYDSRRLYAVLCGRARVVQLFDRSLKPVGSAPAGTGPARIASDGRAVLYVTDAVGESLLVYHLHPRFELIRRVALPGTPSEIAHTGDRLRITVSGRELEYADGSRPVPCTRSPRC